MKCTVVAASYLVEADQVKWICEDENGETRQILYDRRDYGRILGVGGEVTVRLLLEGTEQHPVPHLQAIVGKQFNLVIEKRET